MAAKTGIAWTDSTFNPWIGCTKVSPGCDHCYAEARMDKRLHIVSWGARSPRKRTGAANWREPVTWNAKRARAIAAGENPAPHYVFCSSLADVFDNEVDSQWRVDLLRLIADTPNLTWQLLTKRIGNAHTMMTEAFKSGWPNHHGQWERWPELFRNVWIGATVVNQEEADRDIPKLLAVPAAKRFLSIEPMLGPIDLQTTTIAERLRVKAAITAYGGMHIQRSKVDMLDWVIAGGESGPQSRPAHPDWFRSLRDQCKAAGVPFFMKQWGEWTPGENVERVRGVVDTAFLDDDGWNIYPLNLATDDGHIDDQPDLYRVGTKAAGNTLDGNQHIEFPA